MGKNILIWFCIVFFVQSYAQKYSDKDFIGYVNYTNIPLVNVRFNPLLFDHVLDREPEWYSKNKIKKITYLMDGQFYQSFQYSRDGNVVESNYEKGSKYLTSKNKDEIITIGYNNDKENTIVSKKMTPDGKLLRIKSQYATTKNDSTINKFYYENNRIVKKEQYFNNKIQRKSEFKYDKNLLVNMINMDYAIQVQPNQTRESDNIIYKYDSQNNCISIEGVRYFGVLKDRHFYKYSSKNKLLREDYILNEGKGSEINEGSIEYAYAEKDRLSKISESNKSKASVTQIIYGDNNKVKSIIINCDNGCYSTYFPINFYPGKITCVYDIKYDDKNNMIEINNTLNGQLKNKSEYIIEYY
ncbi:hypothetical protein [Chryseobacterium oryctis]|uniref:YD repeat-containing protein n=1 Tax=Chryseobacterium oryctis TaxID=2952618 RepID=A0ABT3HQE4_9FLAO|nr:hypothetical protein [Chryseobacterium oryctis]MCW3162011.1 hypothetical protein [Chryseobacterium oryctis]